MFGNVWVRCLGRFFAASILIFLMVSVPLSSQVIGSAKSEQTVVCCQDAHDVKLFMTGGDNGELTRTEAGNCGYGTENVRVMFDC